MFASAPEARPGRGIAMVCIMALCFATCDTTVRHLGGAVSLLCLVWVRYAVQTLVMGVWLGATGALWPLRVKRPGFQVLRAVLMMGVTLFSFMGLRLLPVAEFTALAMLTPVLVTLLGGLVLREPVSRLQWGLTLACFGGLLLIVRPGGAVFSLAAGFPLGMAATFAAFQLLTRRMSSTDDPRVTHFLTGLLSTVVLTGGALFALPEITALWTDSTPAIWAQLLAIGLLSSTGHLLLTLALGVAPMSLLMPFTYLQIVGATGLGWWVFDHLPDTAALAGMAVIAGAGGLAGWLGLQRPAARATPVGTDATPRSLAGRA